MSSNNNVKYFRKCLSFHGEGMEMFKIFMVNFFLTIITFGLYYPWAKENHLKYFYNQTEFRGSRFNFSGTGKEMFRGFIKVYLLFLPLAIGFLWGKFNGDESIVGYVTLGFYGLGILLYPFAIHGFLKYRASRSSWRSIRFGYRGSLKELLKIYWKGVIFTLLSFGIYYFWMQVNIRKYTYDHLKFGNIQMKYFGDGADLFVIHLKGYFLMMLTCGIYFFWYQRELFKYEITNTKMIQNGEAVHFSSRIEGSDFASMTIVNFILVVITFGIALPWVYTRVMKFYFSHIWMTENFDEESLSQTESVYKNATGDELMDTADFDLGFFDF